MGELDRQLDRDIGKHCLAWHVVVLFAERKEGAEMIVYLDMDGVLVNFVEGTYRAFGKKYHYDDLLRSMRWNYFEDWGLDFQEVDAVCTTDFWAGLRWMHDGREIISMLEEKFGKKNIFLLTAPMPNPGSGTGKIQWVKRHLPEYSNRLIISSAPKCLFARPNTLLVDDKDSNVDDFWRYGGGKAILVPRPWNELHGWANITLHVVKNSLESL